MPLRLGHFLSLLACIYLMGGHWAVLQSVAWMGMLTDYSHTYGTKQAVMMTFDGAHPCPLCQGIQQQKAQEEKKDCPAGKSGSKASKAALLCSSQRLPLPPPPFSCFRWTAWADDAVSRRDAPPQPVPRGVS